MKKNDLTGQKFGKLTVLKELPERKNKHIYQHCKCECGNETDVMGSNLTSGKSKSCGKCSRGNNLIDQRFGRAVVIEKTNKRSSSGDIIQKCKCDCGNIYETRGDILKSGQSKSCGCLQKDITLDMNKKRAELKILPNGSKYGKLTILKLLDDRNKYGQTVYECRCDCGNIKKINRNDLITGNTQSCGCLKSKGELKISQILKENNIYFETQKVFNDCKFLDTNYPAYFDFWVNNQYVIEFDGIQHFTYRENEGTQNTKENFIKTQERDIFKNNYCFKNNIKIIRVPYTHLNDICIEDLIPETSKFLVE